MKKILSKLSLILIMTYHDKPLEFHIMTIIIRSAFEEDGKFYPQVLLDDALHEV